MTAIVVWTGWIRSCKCWKSRKAYLKLFWWITLFQSHPWFQCCPSQRHTSPCMCDCLSPPLLKNTPCRRTYSTYLKLNLLQEWWILQRFHQCLWWQNLKIKVFLIWKIWSLKTATFFYVDCPARSTWGDAPISSGCHAKMTLIIIWVNKDKVIKLARHVELPTTILNGRNSATRCLGFIDEAK